VAHLGGVITRQNSKTGSLTNIKVNSAKLRILGYLDVVCFEATNQNTFGLAFVPTSASRNKTAGYAAPLSLEEAGLSRRELHKGILQATFDTEKYPIKNPRTIFRTRLYPLPFPLSAACRPRKLAGGHVQDG
jgi:hypothetical protein